VVAVNKPAHKNKEPPQEKTEYLKYKIKTIGMNKSNKIGLITLYVLTLINYSYSIQNDLNLTLYVTCDHLVFGAKGGFMLPKSFIKNDGNYLLFSTDKELQEENLGIYSKKHALYLSLEGINVGKNNIKLGDTLIEYDCFVDSNALKTVYSPDNFDEKSLKVTEYLWITLHKITKRFGAIKGSNRLTIIINPTLKDSKLIDKIDSVTNAIGITTSKRIKNYTAANEKIKTIKEDWNSFKVFSNGCCDDETANFLDSALRHQSGETNK